MTLSGSSWKNRSWWSYSHTSVGPQRLHDAEMQKLRSQRWTVRQPDTSHPRSHRQPQGWRDSAGSGVQRPEPGPMHQAGPRGCGDLMATRVTERTHPWTTGSERSKARAGKEFCFSPSIFLEPFSLPPSGWRCLGNLGGPVPRDAEVSWEEQGWAWGQSSTGAWWKHPLGHHPGAGIKPWRKQEVARGLKPHQDTSLSLVC